MPRNKSSSARPAGEIAPPSNAPKSDVAALDEVFAAFNRSDAPGLAVAVAHQGRTLYRKAFGLANLELGVANTVHTRFRIGSTSKHFTCIAALLLQEEGKLDIDAPADEVLKELPPLKGMPTLRQFMNHTSGYRCHLDLASTAAGIAVQPAGKALAAMVRQTGVNFAPGDAQLYNNGGYHLLSIAIERVAGMPFEQFLKQRVFVPLGMHDTDSMPSDLDVIPGMATLYTPRLPAMPPLDAPAWRRAIFLTEEIRGEGAIVSTVDDMLRWQAHLRAALAGQPRIGSTASWRALVDKTTLNNGLISHYGLGLWRHDFRGLEIVHHGGAVLGGACMMMTVPAQALDIILITNGALLHPNRVAEKVVGTVLSDTVRGPETPQAPAGKHYKHLFGTRYAAERGLVIGFDEADDKLGISVNGSPPMPLLRDDADTVRVDFEDIAAGPLVLKKADLSARADGTAPKFLPFGECGNVIRLKRLPRKAPAAAALAPALVGHYRSVDLDTDARISFGDKQLTMQFQGGYGNLSLTLEPLSDALLLADEKLTPVGMPKLSLVVVREAGSLHGFRLNGVRNRDVWFERIQPLAQASAAPT
ncbi:MAG: beta-lactamase family protein [Chitinophagaceae bacterium]|nr:beta-lactamase family protein [Rubrivivax sp.]